jgi:hypothetical protein
MGLYFIDDTFGDGFVAGIGSSPGGLPYTIGRLGIDFLVIDGLTLGGNAALWLADPEGPGESITGVLFHPRVGYAFAFSDSFGIWPRGGLTIWAVEDFSKFALTAEAMFFATPGDRWGFLFGPTFDAELAGDGGEGLVFGLMSAGIFGWF